MGPYNIRRTHTRTPSCPKSSIPAKGKGKARADDVEGHTDEVLSLALSEGARYLASGGKDRKVGVWDVEKGEWVKGFGGHRDTISVRVMWSHIFSRY